MPLRGCVQPAGGAAVGSGWWTEACPAGRQPQVRAQVSSSRIVLLRVGILDDLPFHGQLLVTPTVNTSPECLEQVVLAQVFEVALSR